MDERLLLPATPELLDGWCGPVVSHFKTADAVEGEWLLLRQRSVMGDVARWHLDLARAECRDRVARVVFGSPATPRMRQMQKGRALFQDFGRVGFFARAETAEDYGGTHAPALADIDPHDDTRLPDGSRLVDALALAAVAREVLR